jgi:ribonuclease HI
MSCVRSVRFSVKINGQTTQAFSPSRGIRQGDPLSPYLFLFIGEALSCVLKEEINKGSITPLKVARGAPGISNLLFADDSLLFFKASVEEARAVDSTLKLFQRCTGQLLSPSKCSILFSSICPEAIQLQVKSTLAVTNTTFEEKYLGLPTPQGRIKNGNFQPIMARFGKRLTNWDERFMSCAAKDTLIKSVAQALPAHVMGIFRLSNGFCDHYERLVRDFWWGDKKEKRKVHWTAWDNLTKPRGRGGLRFRDMNLFNQALLARLAWRLIQHPNSLFARVLKAKYFPRGNILDTVSPPDSSPVWKGVEFGLELLKEGTISRIGNGKDTQFFRDQWLPRSSGHRIIAMKKNSRRRWVNKLIDQGTRSWNTNLLHELFFDHDVQAILEIDIPQQEQNDRLAWLHEKNGQFSVRSAYRLAYNLKHRNRDVGSSSNNPNGVRSIWNKIWKAKVQPKIRVFGWRLATDTLATKNNKWRRTLEVNNLCSICGNGTEDSHHATVVCTKATALRHAMRRIWYLPKEESFRQTGKDWLQILLAQVDDITGARILKLLWRAWHLRNDIIHENGKETIERSVSFLESYDIYCHHPGTAMHNIKGKGKISEEGPPAETRTKNKAMAFWSAPPVGWIKLNTDASFIGAENPGGAGAVVRNSEGLFVMAACSPIVKCHDGEDAEAKAALLGTKMIQGLGFTKVILETDCAAVVSALNCTDIDRSRQWSTYEETKTLLKTFKEVKIVHTKREGNKVADALANLARSAGSCSWRDHLPDCISYLLTIDSPVNSDPSMVI